MSRFTTLPELATFIEYKEKFGLHIPRDPDFLYYFYTIPAQLFVPRFLLMIWEYGGFRIRLQAICQIVQQHLVLLVSYILHLIS